MRRALYWIVALLAAGMTLTAAWVWFAAARSVRQSMPVIERDLASFEMEGLSVDDLPAGWRCRPRECAMSTMDCG